MTAVVVYRQRNERIEEKRRRWFAGGAYRKQRVAKSRCVG
jgi:hypothetical protein